MLMSSPESSSQQGVIENEVNTGIVIAGAYADKLRRTLFAQLRDYVKQSRELAREIARAAAEINSLLYYILVDSLKSDKGDAVRIRVKYRMDPKDMRIKWDYDTLRVEFFKRQSDEEVNRITKKVVEEKLEEVLKRFAEAGREEVETAKTEAVEVEAKTVEKREEESEIAGLVASADPIGDMASGGVVFKLIDRAGGSVGLASVEPRAGDWILDAVVVHKGKAYRVYAKTGRDREAYINNPSLLIEDLSKQKPLPISVEDAKKMIEGKMSEII